MVPPAGASPTVAEVRPVTTTDICKAVKSDIGGLVIDAAKSMFKLKDGPGLLADLAIKYVRSNCDTLLTQAIKLVQGFSDTPPPQVKLPDLRTYASQLPKVPKSAKLAGDFKSAGFSGITPGGIDTLASNLCDDILGVRKTAAADDFAKVLPNADLRQLSRTNQLESIVLDRCKQVTPYQFDGLLASLTGHLTSNQRVQADVLPPILLGPTWSRAGQDAITIRWTGIDASGIAGYELWARTNGTWAQLIPNTTATSVPIRNVVTGNDYLFGLRATDTVGNHSGWSYMSPCLRCP